MTGNSMSTFSWEYYVVSSFMIEKVTLNNCSNCSPFMSYGEYGKIQSFYLTNMNKHYLLGAKDVKRPVV